MKLALLLFLQLFLLAYISQAKVFTVSNRPGNTAQYTKIMDAITAASIGDTIYIQGSETNYDDITVLNKKLVFIGPGHKPNKQIAIKASINNVSFGGLGNLGGSGSTFIGLNINVFTVYGISNITVRRCYLVYIQASLYYNSEGTPEYARNWVIDNNIVQSISSQATVPENFIITNNIIYGQVANMNSAFIYNNIFINPSASQASAFGNVVNSNILNNIFYGLSPEGAETSTFSNNISYQNNATTIPYGTNLGSNNLVDVDPKFTKFPAEGGYFSYEYDFRLQSSSPGKNAATDGKDIGIYGGNGFSETGEPPIPQIREFVINNGVVAPGGKLNITIKAEAKN
jgi:hypothetical protein